MKQQAVVNFAPAEHSVELREIPVEEPGPGEVLVEVSAVGVCGSDVHQWSASHSWPVNYPVVLGHEFAGKVAKVGSGVRKWKDGDRVTSETAAVIDPDSPMTRRGLYNLDPSRKGFGYGVNGAMTRFVRVPERCLHAVPDSVKLETAALTEPCCVAYQAMVHNTPLSPGDRVLVLGPGPIGLLCAAVARLRGAEVAVVGLERDRTRLELARRYGCTPLTEGADAWAFGRGDGLGVEVVVDAAGVSATLRNALAWVRPGGWITKVGWGRDPLNFSLDALVQKNVTLRGSFSHNWPVWEQVLRLFASGDLDPTPIVGGTWPLAQWHDAFEAMHTGAIAKGVLKPS